MIYCWPKFGEGLLGRGMGFGNRLFPWARCRLFAHLNQATMISPAWVRPAIGQVFRGGVDYRSYLRQLVLLGLFRDRPGDLSLLGGLFKTRGLPDTNEPEFLQEPTGAESLHGDSLIVFKGLGRFFDPLQGCSAFLRNELVEITRPRYLDVTARFPSVPIGMCIRCGNDFDPSPIDRQVLRSGEKTPVSWFAQSLEQIRHAAGYPAAAFIVSDGTPEQLQALLKLENVNLVRPGSAVSDLLVMSKSRVLLASGSSSFAAWGAFFGQMPTASHPGQPMQVEWRLTPERGQFLAEFDPLHPNSAFLQQACKALTDIIERR
jgi:hypothetical protein